MTNFDLTVSQIFGKSITIDCNVLMLLIVGSVDVKSISTFKRTNMFDERDFIVLSKLIKNSKIVLTPNVLTEASNLLETYNKQHQSLLFSKLKEIINTIKEQIISSSELADLKSFHLLGLADSSLFELANKGIIPITTDFYLYTFLVSMQTRVINFNHIISELRYDKNLKSKKV
jgi:hypothetical protein